MYHTSWQLFFKNLCKFLFQILTSEVISVAFTFARFASRISVWLNLTASAGRSFLMAGVNMHNDRLTDDKQCN